MGKEEVKDKKRRGLLTRVLSRRQNNGKPEQQESAPATSLLPSASAMATALLPGTPFMPTAVLATKPVASTSGNKPQPAAKPSAPTAPPQQEAPKQEPPQQEASQQEVPTQTFVPPPKWDADFPQPESASEPTEVESPKEKEAKTDEKGKDDDVSDVSSMGMDEPMEETENGDQDDDDDEEESNGNSEQAKNLLRASEWVQKDLYNDETTDEEEDEEEEDQEDLHRLLHKGDWSILKEILLQLKEDDFAIGAALTKLNKKKNTPVHVAVWKAPPGLVKLMFDLISDSLEEDLFLLTNREGNTILHLACANLDVDHTGKVDLTIIKRLVRGGPDAMAMQNNDGDTPLHLLVASPLCHRDQPKHVATAAKDIVTAFLKLNDDPLLMQDSARTTPFHVAIAHKAHERIITRMMDFDPNGIQASLPDEKGMLPLHYIAAFGNVSCEVVKRLIQTYPTSILSVTDDGDTPLHTLASNASNYVQPSKSLEHNLTIITVLLLGMNSHVGTSPLLITNKEDMTPLHCCGKHNAPPQLTRLLLEHPNASSLLEKQDSSGATPLHHICQSPHIGITAEVMLTKAGKATGKIAAMRDKQGRTPMHLAAGNPQASPELITKLVELYPEAISQVTQQGDYPLHLVVQSKMKPATVKAILKAYPKATESRNENGETPLHLACKSGASLGVVKTLLDNNPVAINMPNKNGNVPLHLAVAYRAPAEVIQFILDTWPDGAALLNNNHDTPLHFAVTYIKSTKALKPLVSASPQALLRRNKHQDTPMALAKAANASEEVRALLEKMLPKLDP